MPRKSSKRKRNTDAVLSHHNTAIWPTDEMVQRFTRLILALFNERDPSGTRKLREVISEAELQHLARRAAG